MFYTTWIISTVIAALCIAKGSLGLELLSLDVPQYADVGSSALLGCGFELGDRNLYSVKWYKDDYEFYRFMPDNSPKSQIFPVPGIHLDTSASHMNAVKLDNVDYKSSGTYKCEVSTEGPAFDTVFRSKNMTVYAYPDRPPFISGARDTYAVGDFITVNCTSGKSNPEPVLAWYINGMKPMKIDPPVAAMTARSGVGSSSEVFTYAKLLADSYLLDLSSPKVAHGNPEHPGHVYSRSLGMRTRAEKNHFTGSQSTIQLKCTSTVADMTPQIAVIEPTLASATANQKLAQEMLNEGDLIRVSFALVLMIFLHAYYAT